MTIFLCTHPNQDKQAVVCERHATTALRLLAESTQDPEWNGGQADVLRMDGQPDILLYCSVECRSSMLTD